MDVCRLGDWGIFEHALYRMAGAKDGCSPGCRVVHGGYGDRSFLSSLYSYRSDRGPHILVRWIGAWCRWGRALEHVDGIGGSALHGTGAEHVLFRRTHDAVGFGRFGGLRCAHL